MEHVVQFDTKRRTLPGLDIPTFYSAERREIRKEVGTAVAWLSSARAVGCRLKCFNERNPYPMLNFHRRLPRQPAGRKERMTSSQHDAYVQGDTHPTMGATTGCQTARWS